MEVFIYEIQFPILRFLSCKLLVTLQSKEFSYHYEYLFSTPSQNITEKKYKQTKTNY